MKINDVSFEYHVNSFRKQVHLLDLMNSVQTTLLNEISPDFQRKFIEETGHTNELMNYEWIIYSLNGLTTRYFDYNVTLVFKDEEWLYAPFKALIKA